MNNMERTKDFYGMVLASSCVSLVVYWFWHPLVFSPLDEMVLFILMCVGFVVPVVFSFNPIEKPGRLLLFEGGRIG